MKPDRWLVAVNIAQGIVAVLFVAVVVAPYFVRV